MKNLINNSLLIASVLALGCGARSGIDEVGTLEQPMLSDDNFGVRAQNLWHCSGANDTCNYPPGFGDGSPAYTDAINQHWKVCLDTGTFSTFAQLNRAAVRLTTIRDVLNANGAWVEIVACNQGPNIRISSDNLITGYPPSDIRYFMWAVCDVSIPLSESPSIVGFHRYCTSWKLSVDSDMIDNGWIPGTSNHTEVLEHALGSVMGVAVLGAGLQTGGLNTIWSFGNVQPIGKHNFHAIEYCRARARYDNNGQYFFVTKQDNSCD